MADRVHPLNPWCCSFRSHDKNGARYAPFVDTPLETFWPKMARNFGPLLDQMYDSTDSVDLVVIVAFWSICFYCWPNRESEKCVVWVWQRQTGSFVF